MKLFLSKKASEPTYTSNFFSCLTFPCNTISIKQNHKETLEIHCIPLLTELALMSSGISLMLGFLLSCKEMISSTASSSFLWSMSIKFSCSLVPAMVPWESYQNPLDGYHLNTIKSESDYLTVPWSKNNTYHVRYVIFCLFSFF